MTKLDLVNLFQSLHQVKELKGIKFAYSVIKNINIIKSEIEALQKASESSLGFIEYEKKRIELAKKFAKKDKGEPVIEGDRYILEDEKKFGKEWEKLKKEYEEEVGKREWQIKQCNDLLMEDSDIKLHKIKMADVPQDISVKLLEGIFAVIEE